MIAAVLIFCVVVFIATIAVSVSGGKDGGAEREVDPRLLELEFRGVVVENTEVAHAFDAGYSRRVKIKCDDGNTVTMTTPIFGGNQFRVGTRVVKRAGAARPVPDKGTAGPGGPSA
ncbi:hypothetical protein KDK95_09650 [Actinospica sp. MGRD01-02]|uniref:Uncharacterized protein n=1 Tax=Actinospica acidithermotolerans TaxID=2828514 RepID=A0A941E9Y7_9ACTN|nr:hypothetical protein [Actinospica acidithermotolerans]MBR7826567.1 hypothetical protein [Actinospica acidithermotolerans]